MEGVEKVLTLRVHPRGVALPRLPEEVEIHLTDTVNALYKRLATAASTSVHRLRITRGSDGGLLANSETTSILATGLKDQSVIYVKDLGPQISWRLVFIIEYLGPLLIHPLVYLYQFHNGSENYSWLRRDVKPEPSMSQQLVLGMILIHFIKRELETVFVHRFSASTMPLINIFKNSAHYWLLAGLNLAYWTYLPKSLEDQQSSSDIVIVAAIGFFVIGEVGNLVTHLALRSLRRAGSTERGIPRGFGFDLVTCPNYMFETIAWLGIVLASGSLSSVIFVMVAVGQMVVWARKKEVRNRQEFGDKYKNKKYCMLPGVI